MNKNVRVIAIVLVAVLLLSMVATIFGGIA